MIAAPALALAMGLFAAPATSPRIPMPVAVMPFKNLNDDPGLDWLRSGIAETMISDMKKSGRVDIVEREQIDRALGEVMLQSAKATDEATAVKVGKIVGAKTIVLGSFQQAAKEIRINARFVNVETGVVIDTAKATGSSAKIFALQDEVVDKLLGAAPAGRPKRSQSEKTFQAYRLYAMALTVASDADRVGYLKKSLDVDPDFVYAQDELAALELRLGGYEKTHRAGEDAAIALFWKTVDDPKATTTERATAANALLVREQNARHYHGILDAANRIIAANIPAPGPGFEAPSAFSLFETMQAYYQLKKFDLAMQVGERYLTQFPTGLWYSAVDQQIRAMIDTRRKQEDAKAKLAARFAELAKTRAEAEEKAKTASAVLAPHYAEVILRADLERCWRPSKWDMELYEVARTECQAFLRAYANDPAAKSGITQARFELIEATAQLGDFEEAQTLAAAFVADFPAPPGDNSDESVWSRQIQLMMKSWPTD